MKFVAAILLTVGIIVAAPSARKIEPFLLKYCVDCHDTETSEGGLNLQTLDGKSPMKTWIIGDECLISWIVSACLLK